MEMQNKKNYRKLKRELQELGYSSYDLPLTAVRLVECIVGDLLQTTRSLQHYMEVSKEALCERDSLKNQLEPYKKEYTKLLQETNSLHKTIMFLKEENEKLIIDSKQKIKTLTIELQKKESFANKLQEENRELNRSHVCAGTQTNVNKPIPNTDKITDRQSVINEIQELRSRNKSLEVLNQTYVDKITSLEKQVDNRNDEILRLNMHVEGGRPMKVHPIGFKCEVTGKNEEMQKYINVLQKENLITQKELDNSLEKQHEAMLRALKLADNNKILKAELEKVDSLALKVEEDCNNKLATMTTELQDLQNKLRESLAKIKQLEANNSKGDSNENNVKLKESLHVAMKEKNLLQQEIHDLIELNKILQCNIQSFAKSNKQVTDRGIGDHLSDHNKEYNLSQDILNLLESQRKIFETYLIDIQAKLQSAIKMFEHHFTKCSSLQKEACVGNDYTSDLQNKLCENEQSLLMLKLQNKELHSRLGKFSESSNENYRDIISQLNVENSELTQENISLCKQLAQYKNVSCNRKESSEQLNKANEKLNGDVQHLSKEIEKLTNECHVLRKDKEEYNRRYKEATEMIDKLKQDLIFKQRQFEQVEDENNSFRITNRSSKASSQHVHEECKFLREQLQQMQTDIIKEKTLVGQLKNVQIETERSNDKFQNELLLLQKHLSISKDTTESLENKCKNLQAELAAFKNEKMNLLSNLKKLDYDRDKFIMELDQKTETISRQEQKLKSQAYNLEQSEKEILELKRKLKEGNISEHKLQEYESQLRFLNDEIYKLTRQLENAIAENKNLQSTLTDNNATYNHIKAEYDKSRKEVDSLKQQLQHYVAEIRRIEELLSHKEAERTDMLEQYASLSVEANMLESTNHSLESETASKSQQLVYHINRIQELESHLLEKSHIIDCQNAKMGEMTLKINSLETEIKLITEERAILEQNSSYLKEIYSHLQSERDRITQDMSNSGSELKLYEQRIKSLSTAKAQLELEKIELKQVIASTEKLLTNAKSEILDLKLALKDATSETKMLQDQIFSRNRPDLEFQEMNLDELHLPLSLEETLQDISQEEDHHHEHKYRSRKTISKFHSGTI